MEDFIKRILMTSKWDRMACKKLLGWSGSDRRISIWFGLPKMQKNKDERVLVDERLTCKTITRVQRVEDRVANSRRTSIMPVHHMQQV